MCKSPALQHSTGRQAQRMVQCQLMHDAVLECQCSSGLWKANMPMLEGSHMHHSPYHHLHGNMCWTRTILGTVQDVRCGVLGCLAIRGRFG